MSRNLDRRVEAVFPIEAPELKKRLIEEIWGISASDNVKRRKLMTDGTYTRIVPQNGRWAVRSLGMELGLKNAVPRWYDGLGIVPLVRELNAELSVSLNEALERAQQAESERDEALELAQQGTEALEEAQRRATAESERAAAEAQARAAAEAELARLRLELERLRGG
jgi:hypothetical protein